MKIISVLSLFIIMTVHGVAQPDLSGYYAASASDYYTNEETGEIMVYVPEAKKERRIAIDLVFEYEVLNRSFPVSSSGVSTVPFPMKLLREGQNEVTVSFFEDEKWVDSRKVFVLIRPHTDNEVKINRATGGLFANGLPVFPFGFYSYSPLEPGLPDEGAIDGFNMISPYQKIERKSLKERKAYMKRCADIGIRVNYNLCSVAGGGGPAGFQSELSKKEKMELLRREVEMFRGSPSLLTWYIADEPDAHNIPADSLLEYYRLIKELDPYHPVTILLTSPRKAAEFRNVTDIVMTNPYPIPQGKIVEVKDYTDVIKNTFLMEKPVWVVPQIFGGNDWWQREPTPKEVRAMTYMAIIHGATGIQYFVRKGPNSFPKSIATWDECGTLAMEIAEMAPDILSPHPVFEPTSEIPGIHAKAWNRAGLVTIAVVNERNEPLRFDLKLGEFNMTINADVLFEDRLVVIAEGVLNDMIDGYGTRVYRFDARRKPDQVKGLEPGNLTVDPGFENLSNAGVPAACYAGAADDRGSTYFIDSRRYYQGDHSLRMNNPSGKPGNELSFFGLNLSPKKSYSVSIMAKTGPSSNEPGGKKGGPVQFTLGMDKEERNFDCTNTWEKYEIYGIRITGQVKESDRTSPRLQMTGKGTAWFDLLQVYPDIEMTEGRGSSENMRMIELKCIHPDAKIYYTLDGTEPSAISSLYQVPLEIQGNATLKAAAFKDGAMVGYFER